MNLLIGLTTALSIPLMILNTLGGIVSGIWLAVLGEWGAIGLGVLFFFVGASSLLELALIPSWLLMQPALYCSERNNIFGLLIFGALSSVYTLTLITIWCCGILFLFVKDATESSLIPRLIWSYGVAVGPWAAMASEDRHQGGQAFASTLVTFLAQLAYVAIILLVLFTRISLIGALKVFGSVMAVGLILQLIIVVLIHREQRQMEQRRFAEPSAQ